MLDISTVGIIASVPKRSALETSCRELSEDISFGISNWHHHGCRAIELDMHQPLYTVGILYRGDFGPFSVRWTIKTDIYERVVLFVWDKLAALDEVCKDVGCTFAQFGRYIRMCHPQEPGAIRRAIITCTFLFTNNRLINKNYVPLVFNDLFALILVMN